MNAIKLLTQQHRDVEDLFEAIEEAGEQAADEKVELCRQLGDALAVHATIEEKVFYPATKDLRTEDLLREAVEEHLAARHLVADLLHLEGDDPRFDASLAVLKDQVEHHVLEEEQELFPVVKERLDAGRLEELGREMERMAEELEGVGEARAASPDESDRPAPF